MTGPSRRESLASKGAIAARRLALSRRRAAVDRRSKRYAETDEANIVEEQDAMLRSVWERALEEQPFYRMWAKHHNLPFAIREVRQLQDFPPLTKDDLRKHHDLVFARSSSASVYSTGGSTGTPVHYPRGRGEALDRYAAAYVARLSYGIQPGDPYVHLWGDSGRFGSGHGAIFRRRKRHLLDRGLGAVRLNAYDLSPETLDQHAYHVWRANPAFIVGYTSAVVRLARTARTQQLDISALTRLKAVLVTAETLSEADRDLLQALFRVPVINEYGSAETGAVAVSCGETWPLRVLWDSVAVTPGGHGDIHLTTLHSRTFPLINYQVGDQATGLSITRGSVLSIQSIKGRSQDNLSLRRADGGTMVASAIMPTHILKALPAISAVQIYCENEHVFLYITADEKLDLRQVKDFFFTQVASYGTLLDSEFVQIVQIDRPYLTRVGKQPLMLAETPPSPHGDCPEPDRDRQPRK